MPAPTKTEFALAAYNKIDDAGEHIDVDDAPEDLKTLVQELIDLPYGYDAEHRAKEQVIFDKMNLNYEYHGSSFEYSDGSEYTYEVVRDKRDDKLWQTYSTHTSWVGTEYFFDEFEEVEAYVHTETKYRAV